MAIDWLNPSQDVLDARRVGYEHAESELTPTINELMAEIEKLKAENKLLCKQRNPIYVDPSPEEEGW